MPADHPSPDNPLELLRDVSRSFHMSIRLLPAALRVPVGVAYLLARATDTIADTAQLPAADRRDKLDALSAAIEGRSASAAAMDSLAASFTGLEGDPGERALILALPQCIEELGALSPGDRADVRAVLRHIVYGQGLDIERFGDAGAPRALRTAAQLDEYTYLVAGCVGEFWTDLCARHLPGFAMWPREQMRELARAYGMGLQLVNILRDAGADLAAGRCYFPAEELAAAGLQPQDIARNPERFASVRNKWLQQAQCGLDEGMRYCDALNPRRLRAASALPALLGVRTLALLRADPAQGLGAKVKVPRAAVRRILARIAVTLAGRQTLQALYAQGAAMR